MISTILASITNWIIHVISTLGYTGVGLLMAIESAAIPIPSEVIMPFSGFLVHEGRFTWLGISLAGGIGSAVGSFILYYIGYFGGRPLIEKYGKYILISTHDLESADVFFKKYGNPSTFIGRMLPVVRTFISFPAGVAKSEIKTFLFYSFVGSFIWSGFLGWIGIKMGENWENLKVYFHRFDFLIVILAILAIVYWVWRHFRKD